MTNSKRAIVHVDMDAFYASVEQRDNPELRGKALVVGHPSSRGVVAAASYESRKFGIRSAMPIVHAQRRCSTLIIVPPRIDHYRQVSRRVFAIFHRFTPVVEALSLDEAFLDVTGSQTLFGDPVAIAESIRAAIHADLSLTASAGIANSKFAAKIASDMNKPDGITIVPADVARFLAPLPIERMWGVGPKAAAKLHQANLRTFKDVQRVDLDTLKSLLGSWGEQVKRLSLGVDNREVEPDHDRKSIGAEETFEQDVKSREELQPFLLRQCRRVAQRLRKNHLQATTINLKLKYADHTIRTRQTRLPRPANDSKTLHLTANTLLHTIPWPSTGVRLVGISASHFDEPQALELFHDPQREKTQRVESVEDQISTKYGNTTLLPASLLNLKNKK